MWKIASLRNYWSNISPLEYWQQYYLQDSRVLHTFVPIKSFGKLLDISSKNFIFLKTFDLEFLYIKVWITDQNSKPLELDDKIDITLIIN